MFLYVYNLILTGKEIQQTRAICENGFKKIYADVELELAKLWPRNNTNGDVGNDGDEEDAFEATPLKNPPINSKGVTNTRLKGHFEKRTAKPNAPRRGKKSVVNGSSHQQSTLATSSMVIPMGSSA
ncbi:hypothetical protein RIF29_16236 [Crotalaria pallida]|uniref:Uncharacterized protein n=1 Tax=Crotalaria pallida TaxID=3830 RepID=A0AAN9FEW7_CROPI